MTDEKQSWRPPLAPKPPSSVLQATSNYERTHSPALRGAVTAFSPPPGKSTVSSHTSSAGALLAAAAAGKARSQQAEKDGIGTRTSVSPIRGRSQLAIELQRAATQPTIASRRNTGNNPPLNLTPSAVAARTASANTSPARGSDSSLSRGGSPQNRSQHARSREPSILSRGRKGSGSQGSDALSGATASISASPNGMARSPLSQGTVTLDLDRLPILGQPSLPQSSQSKQTQSDASTSAARAASRGQPPRRSLGAVAPSLLSSKDNSKMISLQEAGAQSAMPLPSHSLRITTPQSDFKDESYFQGRGTSDQQSLKPTAPLPIPVSQLRNNSPRPHVDRARDGDLRASMTVSRLADAMVASSLASSRVASRAQSPVKSSTKLKPPAPAPRRRSRSLATLESRSYLEDSPAKLSPMPIRPMKQTLRKKSPGRADEDEAKRGRKHWMRKHPNQHHEGDRKRWRDKVTERERKRYEGVWAANRGLLWEYETLNRRSIASHKSSSEEDLVLNVVVRDIWDRSRLPRDALEEVWDLVATGDSRFLNREEFVVGLWLIDQRLKGRKLPVKVSPSVWSSVRHTQGVKISRKPL